MLLVRKKLLLDYLAISGDTHKTERRAQARPISSIFEPYEP
jgi:hypothetical protein